MVHKNVLYYLLISFTCDLSLPVSLFTEDGTEEIHKHLVYRITLSIDVQPGHSQSTSGCLTAE